MFSSYIINKIMKEQELKWKGILKETHKEIVKGLNEHFVLIFMREFR